MKGEKMAVSLEVYDPTGTMEIIQRHAPRLDDLSGKTICEIPGIRLWEWYRTFPYIRERLQKRFPDAKIVPYTEFPGEYNSGTGDEVLSRLLREKQCDGVIVGNAG